MYYDPGTHHWNEQERWRRYPAGRGRDAGGPFGRGGKGGRKGRRGGR